MLSKKDIETVNQYLKDAKIRVLKSGPYFTCGQANILATVLNSKGEKYSISYEALARQLNRSNSIEVIKSITDIWSNSKSY